MVGSERAVEINRGTTKLKLGRVSLTQPHVRQNQFRLHLQIMCTHHLRGCMERPICVHIPKSIVVARISPYTLILDQGRPVVN